jgi:hypothetical protein
MKNNKCIVAPIRYVDDEEREDPMTPDHFKLAIRDMGFSSDKVVHAVFSHLCCEMSQTEAAKKYDIPPSQVSRAVSRIKENWQLVYNEMGLVYESVAIRPEIMKLIREAEKLDIADAVEKRKEGWEMYKLDEEFDIE